MLVPSRARAAAALTTLLLALTPLACGDDGGGGGATDTATADTTPPADTSPDADTSPPADTLPDADTAPADTAVGPLTCGAGSAQAVAGCVDQQKIGEDLDFIAAPRPAGSAHWKAVQDRCFDRLAALGYTVERQDWGGGVNVIGVRAGTSEPDTAVVLGAHYDHIAALDPRGRACPGADDNGSGVAGLLEAARVLATRDTARTLVVACWDGEENGLVGSRAWATDAANAHQAIALAVVFEMIGFRATEPDTQTLPPGFDAFFADASAAVAANDHRGDFIAIVGNAMSSAAMDRIVAYGAETGAKAIPVPVPDGLVKSSAVAQLRRSDHAAFWDRGYPAFMLTDTADFRNPNYHCQGGLDTVSTLDLAFIAGVVANAVGAVGEVLDGAVGGAPPTGVADACDPIAQDCSDGERCANYASTSDFPAECHPPGGTGAALEDCSRPSGVSGDDTCGVGLYCAFWGRPLAADGSYQRQCLRYCGAATDCGAGYGCRFLLSLPYQGLCAPACDPFAAAGCGAGQGCIPLPDTRAPGWAFFCNPAVTTQGAEGAPCSTHESCADGLGCDLGSALCAPWCDAAHPCAGGRTCTPLLEGTPIDGLGTCSPN